MVEKKAMVVAEEEEEEMVVDEEQGNRYADFSVFDVSTHFLQGDISTTTKKLWQ